MTTHVGPFAIDEALGSKAREVFQSALGVEGAVAFLRTAGAGKPVSLRILVTSCGVSLREAKRLIELSPVWKDRREADEAFRQSAILALGAPDAEPIEASSELRKAS